MRKGRRCFLLQYIQEGKSPLYLKEAMHHSLPLLFSEIFPKLPNFLLLPPIDVDPMEDY